MYGKHILVFTVKNVFLLPPALRWQEGNSDSLFAFHSFILQKHEEECPFYMNAQFRTELYSFVTWRWSVWEWHRNLLLFAVHPSVCVLMFALCSLCVLYAYGLHVWHIIRTTRMSQLHVTDILLATALILDHNWNAMKLTEVLWHTVYTPCWLFPISQPAEKHQYF